MQSRKGLIVAFLVCCTTAHAQDAAKLRDLVRMPSYSAGINVTLQSPAVERLKKKTLARLAARMKTGKASGAEIYWTASQTDQTMSTYAKKALPLLRKEVRLHPHDPRTLATLAMALSEVGKHAEARKVAEAAADKFPKSAVVWGARAQVKIASLHVPSIGKEDDLEAWRSAHADVLDNLRGALSQIDEWISKGALLSPTDEAVMTAKVQTTAMRALLTLDTDQPKDAVQTFFTPLMDSNFQSAIGPVHTDMDLAHLIQAADMLMLSAMISESMAHPDAFGDSGKDDTRKLPVFNADPKLRATASLIQSNLQKEFSKPGATEKAAIAAGISLTYLTRNQDSEAMSWLSKAASLDKRDHIYPKRYFDLAWALGKVDAAVLFAQNYLVKSEDPDVRFGLAKVFERRGEVNKAAQQAAKLKAAAPQNDTYQLAYLAMQMRSGAKADLGLLKRLYEKENPDATFKACAGLDYGIAAGLAGNKDLTKQILGEVVEANADANTVEQANAALDILNG